MGFHHVALATRDLPATHRFYTGTMGFELAKVIAAKSPEGGWAKHVFYRTPGGDMMAFWELHEMAVPESWSPAISTGIGLPAWVNHIAFRAGDLDEIERRKRAWLAAGHDALEGDHGWCASVYTVDPNGIRVGGCAAPGAPDAAAREEAERLLADPPPPLDGAGRAIFHKASAA